MRIRFYNEGGRWYADLPKYIQEGGDKEDLLMVAGADTWLDILSECGSEITLEISTEHFDGFDSKLLYVGDIHTIGASTGDYIVYPDMHKMWLCGVTVWVFGEYPQVIYYKVIS
jgi:hypothetical protein